MSRGNITRRGKNSWRIKFDTAYDNMGNRKTRYVTVKGKRQDAQRELTKLLAEADAGTLVQPSKNTIKEHIKDWLDGGNELAPKTVERYRELAENQIYPDLGGITLQKLKPIRVAKWHVTLLKTGSKGNKPLSARTVGHAHRVLHRALQRAVEHELLSRNVASIISPPAVDAEEVEILTDDEVLTVLRKLEGHSMYSIVAVDLATGLRRGELLALAWNNIDLEAATLRVERSLQRPKPAWLSRSPRPTTASARSPCHRMQSRSCSTIAGSNLSCVYSWASASLTSTPWSSPMRTARRCRQTT